MNPTIRARLAQVPPSATVNPFDVLAEALVFFGEAGATRLQPLLAEWLEAANENPTDDLTCSLSDLLADIAGLIAGDGSSDYARAA